jgi:hypothetical protein
MMPTSAMFNTPLRIFASDPQKDNGTDGCSTVSDEEE